MQTQPRSVAHIAAAFLWVSEMDMRETISLQPLGGADTHLPPDRPRPCLSVFHDQRRHSSERRGCATYTGNIPGSLPWAPSWLKTYFLCKMHKESFMTSHLSHMCTNSKKIMGYVCGVFCFFKIMIMKLCILFVMFPRKAATVQLSGALFVHDVLWKVKFMLFVISEY